MAKEAEALKLSHATSADLARTRGVLTVNDRGMRRTKGFKDDILKGSHYHPRGYRLRRFSSNVLANRRRQAGYTLVVAKTRINHLGLTGNALISPVGGGDSPFLPEPLETPLSLSILFFPS